METCFICGNEAHTDEHIIPKWLQRKYNLWDQKVKIPNGTTIAYRQLTIKCCEDCNNIILSNIETQMQHGIASDEEVWKWATKIHFGLLRKDDFLEWDRKNPGYKIGDIVRSNDPLEIDRHLVHTIHGEFTTVPSPFGSVYRFNFDKEEEFYFAHLIEPPAICINTGKIGYTVFIRDTGALKRTPSINEMYDKHASNSHIGKMLNFFANAWVHLYRFKVSRPFVMSKNSIAILGRGKLIEEIPFSDEMFEQLWHYLNAGNEAKIVSNEEYEEKNAKD
ncbi:hypothetical protein HZF36_08275 [Treponema socranskii]